MKTKIISLIVVLIVIANLLLFAFRKVNSIFFWSIIILCAIFAYKILPMMKKK